jgi:hypothetical protein
MKQLLPALFLILFILLLSCSRGVPADNTAIISEEKMVNLLIESHLADAILSKDESSLDRRKDMALYFYPSVLEKYGVTRAQMDSSVSYYIRHPKVYLRIYDKVLAQLEKDKGEVKPKNPIE